MIFHASEPPLAIPQVPLTPLLLELAIARGSAPAFIDGSTGRVLTCTAWAESVVRTAAGFATRGLRKGEVVALCSPNLPEYAVAFHAASFLGGITTTMNPLCTAGELHTQLLDADAKYVVTVPPLVPKLSAASRGSAVRELFVFGESDDVTSFDSLGALSAEPTPAFLNPTLDVAALPYSSGTGGLPKGVMLTHANVVANMLQAACALHVLAADTLLAVLPLFHIYGLGLINVVLYQGATAVTLPRFDFVQMIDVIQRHRVTYLPVVPPIVLALARSSLSRADVPSLRVVLSGAAPLDDRIATDAAATLGCPVVQGYGLTETSPVTHATRVGSATGAIAGVGPPVPNTEAKVVELETGLDCEADRLGEIWVRGPQVMKGYLNRPEATATTIDADGWLHTGDVGYADHSGRFFVVDRVKELIKHKGLQIAPAELEALLMSHPAIADAAVVPVPDETAGQVPKAFVVPKRPINAEEIQAYVSERVAPYKKLHAVEYIERIPRSPAGKILRRLLIQQDL